MKVRPRIFYLCHCANQKDLIKFTTVLLVCGVSLQLQTGLIVEQFDPKLRKPHLILQRVTAKQVIKHWS